MRTRDQVQFQKEDYDTYLKNYTDQKEGYYAWLKMRERAVKDLQNKLNDK